MCEKRKQNQSVHARWPVAFASGVESCGRTNEITSTTSKENLSKDFICCFLATSWKNIFHPSPHSASAERRKNIFVFPIHPQLFSFRAITRRNKPQHIDSESKKAMHTKGWKKILLNQIKWDIRLFYTYFSRVFFASNFSRYVVFSLFRSDLISFPHALPGTLRQLCDGIAFKISMDFVVVWMYMIHPKARTRAGAGGKCCPKIFRDVRQASHLLCSTT